jgi:hypothetical protein
LPQILIGPFPFSIFHSPNLSDSTPSIDPLLFHQIVETFVLIWKSLFDRCPITISHITINTFSACSNGLTLYSDIKREWDENPTQKENEMNAAEEIGRFIIQYVIFLI